MARIFPCVLLLLSSFISNGHSHEEPDAVLTLEPKWSQLFTGETVTFTCDMREGKNTDWWYNIYKDGVAYITNSVRTNFTFKAESVDSGEFQCTGVHKEMQVRKESNEVTLIVSDKPQPVLTVSPQWLSPGASVTLSCDVKESSEGWWRFYWYRAVPKPSNNYYNYELLPGSHHGTVEGSYIIHGPTGTGGYVCKAGRGDPVYYTRPSEPQFVWSGDVHILVSLTVSSNRTQHFLPERPLPLSCEGISTEWKVKKYPDEPSPLHRGDSVTRVYWCESGLGEYSNAVNITIHYGSVILVSPVHPVTEGHSVSLQCKHDSRSSLSNVDFYRNEDLVQSKTNGEMIMPAVSKSDEGFYKCKYSGGESPQSWMTVRYAQPSLPGSVEPGSPHVVGVIVGLVVVILLTILLLLLCRYRRSKAGGANVNESIQGSQATGNHEPAAVSSDGIYSKLELKYMVKKDEPAAESSDGIYSKIELKYMAKKDEPAAGSSVGIYSKIELKYMAKKDEPAAESSDGIYSKIELRYMAKKENPADPLESSLYSEITDTEPGVTYAQVNHQNKDKAWNKKEKTEDTVYSQVKPEAALG